MRKFVSFVMATAVAMTLVAVVSTAPASATSFSPMQAVGTLAGPEEFDSSALAVNDAGFIVGVSPIEFGIEEDGFVRDPVTGGLTDLKPIDQLPLKGDHAVATAVNGHGVVAGVSNIDRNGDAPDRAVVWNAAGVATNLGTIGNRPCPSRLTEECDDSGAAGINDGNLVVGSSEYADDPPSGGQLHHAFVDDLATMTMTDLGALAGGANSNAAAINDADVVVGDSEVADGHGGVVTHAFAEDLSAAGGRVMVDLGTLPGDVSSTAVAINGHGLVVGTSTSGAGAPHPFVYDLATHTMTALGLPSGASGASARAVNDDGLIVGDRSGGGAWLHDPTTATFTSIPDADNATDINASGEIVGNGLVPEPLDVGPPTKARGAYFTTGFLHVPPPPTQLRIDSSCGSPLLLRWKAAAVVPYGGVSSYQVLRDGAQIAVVTGTAFSDPSAPATATYTVAALNPEGRSARSNAVTFACAPALSGRVTSGGRALGGIAVRVTRDDGTLAAKTTTGADGAYNLQGIAPGSYKVRFSDSAGRVVLQWNGGAATEAEAAPVVVATGATRTVDADMVAAGRLTGTVLLDGFNDDGAIVRVYAVGQTQAVTKVVVPSEGPYVVAGLAPGQYQLLFSDDARGAVSAWNGGASKRTAAPLVTVTAGSTTTVDASLSSAS